MMQVKIYAFARHMCFLHALGKSTGFADDTDEDQTSEDDPGYSPSTFSVTHI